MITVPVWCEPIISVLLLQSTIHCCKWTVNVTRNARYVKCFVGYVVGVVVIV